MWLHEGEVLLEHVWNIRLRVQKVLKDSLPSGMCNVEDSHLGVHKLNSWVIFYHRKGSVWCLNSILQHISFKFCCGDNCVGHQNSVMLLRCVLIVPFEAQVTDRIQ